MLLVKSNLRELVTSVKQLLSSHGRLLSDVKSLLKTMAKVVIKTCQTYSLRGSKMLFQYLLAELKRSQ